MYMYNVTVRCAYAAPIRLDNSVAARHAWMHAYAFMHGTCVHAPARAAADAAAMVRAQPYSSYILVTRLRSISEGGRPSTIDLSSRRANNLLNCILILKS